MNFRDCCFKTLRLRHPATSSRPFRRIHAHSIAEELWHIVFWQDHFLRCARREGLVYPQHAKLGWRRPDSFSNSQWQELVAQFESGLTEAADIAGQTRLAESYSTLEEPGSGTGPLTLQELIVNLAVHNAYHLGRIVQLLSLAKMAINF